jgi:uncharacterized protein YecA (UPF0149 family)
MNLFKKMVRMFHAQDEQTREVNLGRNESCWCGSGKKYKKCHLMEDEKKAKRNYGLNCGKT